MNRSSFFAVGVAAIACVAAPARAQNITNLQQFSTFACQFTAKSVRVLSAQNTVDELGDPLTVYALVNYKDHAAVMSEASSGYVPVTAMVGPLALHLVSASTSENLIVVTVFARTAAKTDGPTGPTVVYRAAMSRHLPGGGTEGVVAQYDGSCRGVS